MSEKVVAIDWSVGPGYMTDEDKRKLPIANEFLGSAGSVDHELFDTVLSWYIQRTRELLKETE